MGLVKKVFIYGTLLAIGAGIGTGITKCNIKKDYDLIPKNTIEEKIDEKKGIKQEIEYIKPRAEKNYKFVIDDYVK